MGTARPRRGSTGSRRSRFRVAELCGWHVSSGRQMRDRPGGCASDFKSSSRGLSTGTVGFLTARRPRSKGRHPGRAGGVVSL